MSESGLETSLADWQRRVQAHDSGHAYVRWAELLMQANQTDEAVAVLEKGVASGPVCHGGLLQLGKLLLAKGRDIEARSHLLRLLAQDPENCRALAMLADHARVGGRLEEAARFYQRLRELEPDRPQWKSFCEEVRKRQLERPQELDVADDGQHRRPLSTMTLVDIYLAQGYRDRALAVLKDMLEADPQRQDAQRKLAEIEAAFAGPGSGASTLAPDSLEDGKPGKNGFDSERLALLRKNVTQRRAEEKQQFQAWVAQLRRERKQ